MVVLHDIGVAQRFENPQLGVKLLLFAVGHASVGDFLPATDLAIALAPHFANDAERALPDLLQYLVVGVGRHAGVVGGWGVKLLY